MGHSGGDTSKHMEDRELLRDRKSTSCLTNLVAFHNEMIASVDRGKATDVIHLNFLQGWNRLSREVVDTHHWKCSRSSCPVLWATWSGEHYTCPWQGMWTTWPLKVPPNPNHSMIVTLQATVLKFIKIDGLKWSFSSKRKLPLVQKCYFDQMWCNPDKYSTCLHVSVTLS